MTTTWTGSDYPFEAVPGGPYFNVMSYGAVGGGVITTANGPAFAAAIAAAAAAGGGVVVVPFDRFYFDPTSTITLLPGVSLMGSTPGPFDVSLGNPMTTTLGSTLLITATAGFTQFFGTQFLLTNGFCTIADLIFAYPDQVVPVQSSTPAFVPIGYPWTIAPNFTTIQPPLTQFFVPGTFIRRCTLYNSYRGIRLGAGRCGVYDTYVGPYNQGIQLDNAADQLQLFNVRMGPLVNDALKLSYPTNADLYAQTTLTGYTIGRADAFLIAGCGLEGGSIGFYFYNNGGVGPFGQLYQPYCENVSSCLKFDGETSPNGIQIYGGDFVLNTGSAWFATTTNANGSAIQAYGVTLVGDATAKIPQIASNGFYYIQGYGLPSGLILTSPQTLSSTGPTTYTNPKPQSLNVAWTGGANVAAYWGASVTANALLAQGSPGNVRLPPGGTVTFTYTAASPPTINPYTDFD